MRSRSPDCGRTSADGAADLDRGEVREQLRLGRVAVLQVDDDPVEPGAAEELRRAGRAEARPGAEERLAGTGCGGGGRGSRPYHAGMTATPSGLRHPLWPLYDLRLTTGDLELRYPTRGRAPGVRRRSSSAGIHPPDEMPFGIAWTDEPAAKRNVESYQWWMGSRGRWSPTTGRSRSGSGRAADRSGSRTCAGTSSPSTGRSPPGSWIGREFQGRGIGKLMRQAVLALAFDHLGAQVAETEAFIDNPASNKVSLGVGYEPNGFGQLAPRGVARPDAAVPADAGGLARPAAPRGRRSRGSRAAWSCSGWIRRAVGARFGLTSARRGGGGAPLRGDPPGLFDVAERLEPIQAAIDHRRVAGQHPELRLQRGRRTARAPIALEQREGVLEALAVAGNEPTQPVRLRADQRRARARPCRRSGHRGRRPRPGGDDRPAARAPGACSPGGRRRPGTR